MSAKSVNGTPQVNTATSKPTQQHYHVLNEYMIKLQSIVVVGTIFKLANGFVKV